MAPAERAYIGQVELNIDLLLDALDDIILRK